VQIHGGNGYALEYPISRVLCDARILNIFEGAAEIQAQIIARGLLAGRNYTSGISIISPPPRLTRGSTNNFSLFVDAHGTKPVG
jgi:hypothetical protein